MSAAFLGSPGPLADIVVELRFCWVSGEIDEINFPLGNLDLDVSKMRRVTLKDLGGTSTMSDEQIQAAIDRHGYRGGTFTEILVYAKKQWNGEDEVIAPGSPYLMQGRPLYPYLCKSTQGDYRGRKLLITSWLGSSYASLLVIPK